MNDAEKENQRKLDVINSPKCGCFQDRDMALVRTHQAHALVQNMGSFMARGAEEMGLCDTTLPYILENAIINMAVIIALKGTAIEMGSKEAQWETERVLTGIEGRVLKRVRDYYSESLRLGMTAETMFATREARGETKQ